MGHPKFSRRQYDTPAHPWKADRIKEEHDLRDKYALKNMREIWKARSRLRRHRQHAMRLLSRIDSDVQHLQREREEILMSLKSRGFIPLNASLDDILSMTVEDILDRRLQAVTYRLGLASSHAQARQLVAHGHIAIGNQKVTIPGYIVRVEEEDNISYYQTSTLSDSDHPLRREIEEIRASAEFGEGEEDEGQDPEFNKSDIAAIKESAKKAPSATDVEVTTPTAESSEGTGDDSEVQTDETTEA
ncbi:MAG: 30S ribosomal protein S4 [Euryarchaeota archaeon]|nr:30S ribosomal protein S4 [Euryarchaeota archaeon]